MKNRGFKSHDKSLKPFRSVHKEKWDLESGCGKEMIRIRNNAKLMFNIKILFFWVYQELMSRGTKAVITNITGGKIMKVRWNACYAASNILKKVEGEDEPATQWRTDLVNCLLDLVINFQNFKVKQVGNNQRDGSRYEVVDAADIHSIIFIIFHVLKFGSRYLCFIILKEKEAILVTILTILK